jgi:hypothetical protein
MLVDENPQQERAEGKYQGSTQHRCTLKYTRACLAQSSERECQPAINRNRKQKINGDIEEVIVMGKGEATTTSPTPCNRIEVPAG